LHPWVVPEKTVLLASPWRKPAAAARRVRAAGEAETEARSARGGVGVVARAGLALCWIPVGARHVFAGVVDRLIRIGPGRRARGGGAHAFAGEGLVDPVLVRVDLRPGRGAALQRAGPGV